MFHVPVVKHGVNGELRQKGKIATLACGYGGSSGALISMDEFDGSAGFAKMQSIMQAFRGDIKEFGGKKVVKLLDYAPGLDGLPKSDVLKFLLEDAHQDARYNPMSDGVHERKEWIYWMIPCF